MAAAVGFVASSVQNDHDVRSKLSIVGLGPAGSRLDCGGLQGRRHDCRQVYRLSLALRRLCRSRSRLRPMPSLCRTQFGRPPGTGLVAIRRPAGSCCTSRGNPTSGDISMAGCWRLKSSTFASHAGRRSQPERSTVAWQDFRLLTNALLLRPLRCGIFGGDERHRRRRGGRRRQIRRAQDRLDRHRHAQFGHRT